MTTTITDTPNASNMSVREHANRVTLNRANKLLVAVANNLTTTGTPGLVSKPTTVLELERFNTLVGSVFEANIRKRFGV